LWFRVLKIKKSLNSSSKSGQCGFNDNISPNVLEIVYDGHEIDVIGLWWNLYKYLKTNSRQKVMKINMKVV